MPASKAAEETTFQTAERCHWPNVLRQRSLVTLSPEITSLQSTRWIGVWTTNVMQLCYMTWLVAIWTVTQPLQRGRMRRYKRSNTSLAPNKPLVDFIPTRRERLQQLRRRSVYVTTPLLQAGLNQTALPSPRLGRCWKEPGLFWIMLV